MIGLWKTTILSQQLKCTCTISTAVKLDQLTDKLLFSATR